MAKISFLPKLVKHCYLDVGIVRMTLWIPLAHDLWSSFPTETPFYQLLMILAIRSFASVYIISCWHSSCVNEVTLVKGTTFFKYFRKKIVRFFLENRDCSIMSTFIFWQFVFMFTVKTVKSARWHKKAIFLSFPWLDRNAYLADHNISIYLKFNLKILSIFVWLSIGHSLTQNLTETVATLIWK